MEFSFEVGQTEKHIVQFAFNQFVGNLSIKVDGQERVNDFRMFSLSLVKTYELEIGTEEKHHVKIEKIRKIFFAGFRNTKYRVYIDGILSQQYEGK